MDWKLEGKEKHVWMVLPGHFLEVSPVAVIKRGKFYWGPVGVKGEYTCVPVGMENVWWGRSHRCRGCPPGVVKVRICRALVWFGADPVITVCPPLGPEGWCSSQVLKLGLLLDTVQVLLVTSHLLCEGHAVFAFCILCSPLLYLLPVLLSPMQLAEVKAGGAVSALCLCHCSPALISPELLPWFPWRPPEPWARWPNHVCNGFMCALLRAFFPLCILEDL